MNPGHLGARALTSGSLAGSGVLAYVAAWQRWSGVCPRGGFDEPACLERQDHLYDYQWPASPWHPIGHAAEVYGLSVVLLAVAAFTLPFLLMPVLRRHTLWPLAVIPAVVLAGYGVLVLASGIAGRPVTVPGFDLTALIVLGVLWPSALIISALIATSGYSPDGWPEASEDRPSTARSVSTVVMVLLIAATTVLPTYFVVGPIAAGYVSHDTAPWSEAPAGVLLVLAAIVMWPATTRVAARKSTRDLQPESTRVS
ncbi:hypothetical protein [Nocardioides luteus]|uniref:hypothetical protein n=1 Tax=Nocardioides luteus TaxID=1844 RepID=UPI0018CA80CC|nr:hypothetical protein [Nocardioides luteus]MBG6097562.1 hypothetical protein [Nocardioides luteus]